MKRWVGVVIPIITFVGGIVVGIYEPYLTRAQLSYEFKPNSDNVGCVIDGRTNENLAIYALEITRQPKSYTWTHKAENLQAQLYYVNDELRQPLYWRYSGDQATSIAPSQTLLVDVYGWNQASGTTYLIKRSLDSKAYLANTRQLADKPLQVQITGEFVKQCTKEFRIDPQNGSPVDISAK
jgi:hypothetical protein